MNLYDDNCSHDLIPSKYNKHRAIIMQWCLARIQTTCETKVIIKFSTPGVPELKSVMVFFEVRGHLKHNLYLNLQLKCVLFSGNIIPFFIENIVVNYRQINHRLQRAYYDINWCSLMCGFNYSRSWSQTRARNYNIYLFQLRSFIELCSF